MKKILATLLACGLALQTCAFASVEISSVEYDKATNKISTSATAGKTENTSVVITVGKKGETLSATNLPEFMYLYKTGASGAIDEDLSLHSDIVSGKYTVYMNTVDGKDQTDVMVLNLNDNSSGGTITVMTAINAITDATTLATAIGDANNMDKLGVDPDLMSVRNAFNAYAAEIILAEKSGEWTVDAFITAYNKALALSSAKSGKNISAVMKAYADEFGTTYEAYTALTPEEKAYVEAYLKGIDYLTADLVVEYANMLSLMKYNAPDTWGELRDVIDAERKAGNDAFDFTAYDKIDTSRQDEVFNALLHLIKDCETEEDIAEEFWNVTCDVLEAQYNEEGEGESSVVGGDWGDTSGDTPEPGHTGTTIPAGNNGDVIADGLTGGNKYDDPTEASTPAPTETPAETEAPALEAGVFIDTSDHWAKDYVKTLANDGVVGGYDDGTFLPNKNVTRAEYIKMIVGMFDLEESRENIFADVAEDAWYKEYVEKALAAGLIEGDGGNFNPDATITRQDAAVILHRLGIAAGDVEISFADEASVSDYAKDAVESLASAGIINGSDGNFNPKNAITRAETAAILCRAAETGLEKEEPTEEPTEELTEEPTEELTEEPAEETVEEPVEDTTKETSETVVDEETTEETADEETTDEETVTE